MSGLPYFNAPGSWFYYHDAIGYLFAFVILYSNFECSKLPEKPFLVWYFISFG